MKKISQKLKKYIRFLVSIIASREFAFFYVLLGTISQVAHTYFLLENISSLEGNWKIFQAVILSIFISGSLLYWVAIADDEDISKKGIEDYKRANIAIWIFTIVEILTNIYYYSRHLILNLIETEYRIFDFVFSILISCLIPISIKMFSANIRSKNWILEFETDIQNKNNLINNLNVENISEEKLLEMLKPMIANFENSIKDIEDINQEKIDILINQKLVSLNNDIDKQISSSYQKNQELFLTQFENKVKMMSHDYLTKLKGTKEIL